MGGDASATLGTALREAAGVGHPVARVELLPGCGVIALLIAVAITPELHLDLRAAITLPLIAVVCTLIEAVAPRGWDNVPMQVVPTLLVAGLLLK